MASDAASLFAELDGIWWGENPEAGVFRKSQFLQPAIGFTLTFPEGWKNQNTLTLGFVAYFTGKMLP